LTCGTGCSGPVGGHGGLPISVAVDDGVCARVGVHCLDNARVPPALALVVRLDGLSLPERERSSVALRRCAIPDPASQHTLFPGSVVVREGEQTVGTGGDRTGVVSAVSAPVTLHPKSCSAWSSVSVCARSSRLSSNLEWIDVVLRVAVAISDVVAAWAVDRCDASSIPPATASVVGFDSLASTEC